MATCSSPSSPSSCRSSAPGCEHGEHASWTTLRRIEGHAVTATFRRPDGRTLHVRTATQAEPEQRAIYDALGVDPQPGGVRKTTI